MTKNTPTTAPTTTPVSAPVPNPDGAGSEEGVLVGKIRIPPTGSVVAESASSSVDEGERSVEAVGVREEVSTKRSESAVKEMEEDREETGETKRRLVLLRIMVKGNEEDSSKSEQRKTPVEGEVRLREPDFRAGEMVRRRGLIEIEIVVFGVVVLRQGVLRVRRPVSEVVS